MKSILIIIVGFFYLNISAQKRVSDSCYIAGHKFILSEKNGIAKLEAFLDDYEITVSKTIKMSPPVFFVKKNTTNDILIDDIPVDNGDIVKIFLLTGNKAPECVRENRNLNFKDDFCGMNVQGVIISPDGITLTELVYNGFTCIRENALGVKDLFTFANSEVKKSK